MKILNRGLIKSSNQTKMENEEKLMEVLAHINIQFNSFIIKKQKQIKEINQQINKLESGLEELKKEIQKKDNEISKNKDTFENTKAALEKQINDEREKSKTISNNLSQLKKDLINLLK